MLVQAIRGGDTGALSRLLEGEPRLARARIGERGGTRTPLHVVTDWPGYFPGGPRTLLLNASPLPAEEGKPELSLLLMLDITARKKAEKDVLLLNQTLEEKNLDLENTQQFLQQVINSSVEFISVLDKDLNYITVNKRFENIIYYKYIIIII